MKQDNEEIYNEIEMIMNEDEVNTSLTSVAKDLIPNDFVAKFKALKKAQDELKQIEDEVKSKMKEVFESIPQLERNSVCVDGLKFTYSRPYTKNTFDSKKFQEENPEEYKKYLKQSNVKSSIRVDVEY
jgi:hypothetical protein